MTTQTTNPNIFVELETEAKAEVEKVWGDIKQFWATEEPIVVGEIKSWAQQLAGIAAGALGEIAQQVFSGTLSKGESFGALVTSIFQKSEQAALGVSIVDAQTAAKQVTEAAGVKAAGG